MCPYHVYVRVNCPSNAASHLYYHRYLLTCASRYKADEFFRAFEARMQFKRISAQFWEYGIFESLTRTITRDNAHSPIYKGVMISCLPDMEERHGFVQVPEEVGRDWLSGHAYFIRNVRQPDVYWYHPTRGDDRILASKGRKTKFFVRLAEKAETETGTVLIRSDRIRISTVSGMVVRMGKRDNKMVMVDPSVAGMAGNDKDFRFGDLLGTFGTDWDDFSGEEYVTWGDRSVMHLDDWELC